MQVLKGKARQRIMESALAEFQEKGFQNASMRCIAKNAGFAVGNIYNYFRDKNELFFSVMEPITQPLNDYIEKMIEKIKDDMFTDRESWSLKKHRDRAGEVALFIHENRLLLEILVFKSHGSCLETYTDDVIEKYTDMSMVFLKRAGEFFPTVRTDVSRFTVHSINSIMVTYLIELLMHKVPYKKMVTYMDEIMIFMYYGWQAVMDCDFEKLIEK
ncbi:hypothetical protein CSA37_00570 [Candidatus Fermentibacteria bacterium]|nr:MAG: hypothetical protein CSA37_09800 [Candidatus Fermentibacteria bacterium]PIE53692.1 MAG: hypothetical protein CSA37_00570 [Candidatus Fermentibacteria bacterium]